MLQCPERGREVEESRGRGQRCAELCERVEPAAPLRGGPYATTRTYSGHSVT